MFMSSYVAFLIFVVLLGALPLKYLIKIKRGKLLESGTAKHDSSFRHGSMKVLQLLLAFVMLHLGLGIISSGEKCGEL